MARFLTILVLAGFLAGMLPPATCRGMDSCCCAKSEPELAEPTAAPTSAPACHAQPTAAQTYAPACHAQPTTSPQASALDRQCPCTPEMRGCAPDREPGTLPAAPAAATSVVTPTVHLGSAPLHATPAIRLPLHPAEPPPLAPLAVLHGVLRI